MPFSLHPQLVLDTHMAGDWPLCRVLLMNDRRFPWLILVPRREGLRDFVDLLPGDQTLAVQEINRASRLLQSLFKPYKLNVAALGNITPQLHIHVIARTKTDAAWPKPVWGVGEAEKYEKAAAETLMARLNAAF